MSLQNSPVRNNDTSLSPNVEFTETDGRTRRQILDDLLTRCSNPRCTTKTRRGNLKLCSRCKIDRYCSQDCQRADWAFHKTICKTTSSIVSLAYRFAQHALAVDDFICRFIIYAIIALDLTTNPNAWKDLLILVPITVSPVARPSAVSSSERGKTELAFHMDRFQVVSQDSFGLAMRRTTEASMREAKAKGLADTVPLVTFLFAPYDNQTKAQLGHRSFLYKSECTVEKTMAIHESMLEEVRTNFNTTMTNDLLDPWLVEMKHLLNKDNVDIIRVAMNDDVQNDTNNAMNLRGYLRV
ncbi:hypothetical protein C8R42DRAFT_447367 [Lentinula raphanica]|nr:hypothetical protein C8R42DRAFT_447367 [Lentinula raphanica]